MEGKGLQTRHCKGVNTTFLSLYKPNAAFSLA